MRAPHVAPARQLERVEDRAEQPVEVGERLHAVPPGERVVEFAIQHPVGEEIDEGVRLGVDVVAVEQHFREVQHLGETPDERLHVADEVGVRAQRVEVDAVPLERREIAHALERPRLDAEALVAPPVLVVEVAWLIQEAEVRSLHVEAHGRDLALVRREVLEDGGEEELHRARLGGETGDPGEVQVRGFRAEQEIGVEVHGGLEPARRVEADGDAGGLRAREVRVHAQRLSDVGIGRDEDARQRHRLQRLLGHLPQYRRRPQPDLLAHRRALARAHRIPLGADDVVQRRREIGVGEPIGDDAIDDALAFFDAHDRADADARLDRRPEMELVRRGGFELGRDDAADGRRSGLVDHVPVRGRREPDAGRKSRGARLRR